MQKMPCKKKKYNSRFPPARIKKIMQSDDEVGKVAAVVPIIISRVLEIFVENLLKDSCKITRQRNARTLTPTHIKASILQNNQLDFLKDIVSLIPDIQATSGDEQIDFNHHHSNNYADYYSSSQPSSTNTTTNNSNHHKFTITKQHSHPATTHHHTSEAPTMPANDVNALAMSNLAMSNLATNSITTMSPSAASSCLYNSSASGANNKRFKNTYSRSNSAPCTSTLGHLIQNADEMRNRKRANRALKNSLSPKRMVVLKRPEDTVYDDLDLDEEDELDESLSDEQDESADGETATRAPSALRSTDQPTVNSATNSATSKSRLETMEDDDYDDA